MNESQGHRMEQLLYHVMLCTSFLRIWNICSGLNCKLNENRACDHCGVDACSGYTLQAERRKPMLSSSICKHWGNRYRLSGALRHFFHLLQSVYFFSRGIPGFSGITLSAFI